MKERYSTSLTLTPEEKEKLEATGLRVIQVFRLGLKAALQMKGESDE